MAKYRLKFSLFETNTRSRVLKGACCYKKKHIHKKRFVRERNRPPHGFVADRDGINREAKIARIGIKSNVQFYVFT